MGGNSAVNKTYYFSRNYEFLNVYRKQIAKALGKIINGKVTTNSDNFTLTRVLFTKLSGFINCYISTK